MNFEKLKSTDCTKYVEKKGNFNYLSWPYMVEQLRINCPDATIHARINTDGMPYFASDVGVLIETYIKIDGLEVWNEWLPVMDFKNKAMKEPTAMDINKTIQRCKAKCISEYLGIGLYLYMGEDLPEQPAPEKKKITIGEANVAWLVGFCKKKEIIAPEEKKTMQEHYGFDPYKTTVEEFAKIKESIMEDYNEA